jgi:formamidopyrimidine-DNA glycosylase
MINRRPRIGERLIYHREGGDVFYKVHSHFRMDGILNIENEQTGEITQIIVEFKKGEFNTMLSFNQ